MKKLAKTIAEPVSPCKIVRTAGIPIMTIKTPIYFYFSALTRLFPKKKAIIKAVPTLASSAG